MKKLMIAAAAVAMVGGAFADPIVYDYKASVKHTYLKAKNINNLKIGGQTIYKGAQIYLKYTKSSSLQGYLIQDVDGVLGNRNGYITYDIPEEVYEGDTLTGTNILTRVCDVRRITKNDAQPGNRCFLVVMNKSAEKQYRVPRIIPGIIDAKWYDNTAKGQTTVPAQGYLYLGGETVARTHKLFDTGIEWGAGEYIEGEGYSVTNKLFVRDYEGFRGTKFANADGMPGVWNFRRFYDNQRIERFQGLPARLRKAVDDGELTYAQAIDKLDRAYFAWRDLWNVNEDPYIEAVSEGYVTRTAEFGIDDYWFTSCYLFGQYNQPAWKGSSLEEFADCWLNGAGFGKAGYLPGKIKACCGRDLGSKATAYAIKQLSGNLKAGIYLCTENGDDSTHSAIVQRTGLLEDQLWLSVVDNSWYGVDTALQTLDSNDDAEYISLDGNWMTKQDIWADGNLDLATTDVGSGTWSIKATTALDKLIGKSMSMSVPTTWGYEGETNRELITNRFAQPTADFTLPLLCTIDAAMAKLDNTCKSGIKLFGNPVGNGYDGTGLGLIGYSFYKNYLAEDYVNRPILLKKFIPVE